MLFFFLSFPETYGVRKIHGVCTFQNPHNVCNFKILYYQQTRSELLFRHVKIPLLMVHLKWLTME